MKYQVNAKSEFKNSLQSNLCYIISRTKFSQQLTTNLSFRVLFGALLDIIYKLICDIRVDWGCEAKNTLRNTV